MKELNQGFYHATAKALAKWWRPSSNFSRPEDINTCVTTTAATMPIQGRLQKFAGVGIRHKGSWSGGTRLHSPTKSGRKLFGTKRYDTTILPWSRTGIGGHRTSKHGFILQGPHKTYSSVEKNCKRMVSCAIVFCRTYTSPKSAQCHWVGRHLSYLDYFRLCRLEIQTTSVAPEKVGTKKIMRHRRLNAERKWQTSFPELMQWAKA